MELTIPAFTIRIPTLPRVARLAALTLATIAFALCAARDAAQTAGSFAINSPDTAGSVGSYTSLALDASGFPVVSYRDDANGDLKVIHCDDANCAGSDESVTAPDTVGQVGETSSLALDASGFPVVSYRDESNLDLKVMHCDDANCAGGGESITSPDTAGDVGHYGSLALDASGFPVISYYDFTNLDLKMMHCDDANCAGGGESITSPDTAGDVGFYSSLALDSSGFPVVTYKDFTNNDLKVMHCNDANCAGGGESITSPDTVGLVGSFTSLALDGSGFPVVSYSRDSDDLKVMHCNDANCTGADESITAPDTAGTVAQHTSLVLDSLGLPVVSYFDATNGNLKLLDCNDANCSGGDDTIVSPDTVGNVGTYTSLALDPSSLPVISYFDTTNGDLKVARASKPSLQLDITNLGQYALPKTCFEVRDVNQVAFFVVCDNDFQGPAATNAICVPDNVCEDESLAAGRVLVTLSSNSYRLVVIKTPPVHGGDTSNQLCAGGSGGTCTHTFINTPTIKPWFPWDVTGDGAVAGTDIFQTIGHFAETK